MNKAIENYIEFLDRASEGTIDELRNYCAADVHFRDPFNDVHSVDDFIAVMHDSYETLSDVRFDVLETFWSDTGAIIQWHFHFRMKPDAELETVTGLSEIRANETGKIIAHIDYWDSGERIYARIPVLGFFVRLVRNRVSAGRNG